MKRLFVAFRLVPDKNTLLVYNSLRSKLRSDIIRWVDPSNFHLTIKFIGKTNPDDIKKIIDIIAATIKTHESINIELNGVGVFGSRYKPRVIWLRINNNKQLNNFALELIDNLNDAGFPKDRQNFVPHITVGRISKIINKQLFNKSIDSLQNVFIQKAHINSIVLYESILTFKSQKYNEVFTFNFEK